jgi:hypothetical protein
MKIKRMVQKIDPLDRYSNYAEYGSAGASMLAPTGKRTAAAIAAEDAAVRTGAAEVSALADAEMVAKGGATLARTGGLWGGIQSFAGFIATPLMLLAGTFQTAKAVKKKDGHGAAQAAGGALGGIAGMMATDAVIGFIGGPVGGVLGAIFGLAVGIGTTIAGGWAGSKAADGAIGDTWHASLNKGGGRLTPSRMAGIPAGFHVEHIPAAGAADGRPGFFAQRIEQERAGRQRQAEAQVPPPGMTH